MTPEDIHALYDKHDGNITAMARASGVPRSTLRSRIIRMGLTLPGQGTGGTEMKEGSSENTDYAIQLPEFADDDIDVTDIIATLKTRFTKRHEARKQRKWFDIKVKSNEPMAVVFVGDPHLDDNGCNWPLIDHHCSVLRNTPGMYAVNIGDTENNWMGRLGKLYADQDTSRKTAHKLTKWFLRDAGINWLCWLMGNHDLWSELPELMRQMNVRKIPMEDWQARFTLSFPNGRKCRIWAAHNHAGHSMWNTLHGAQKAAHMKSEADIYAAGHTHNWAIHQEESASRNFTYWLVRSRGYKFIDEYAEKLGHFPQEEGASITCVINPKAETYAGYIQAFADMDMAADFLTFLRK